MKPRYRVAVLLGGNSSESVVSARSGNAVAVALAEAGHEVKAIDVAGAWLEKIDEFHPDVAFIALHGEFGEDGQIQQILESRGLPYTGSGVEASRCAMNKVLSKRLFTMKGVPTPAYQMITQTMSAEEVNRAIAYVGYPLVVKPASQGSSIGVSVVDDGNSLDAALASAFKYDCQVLIEEFIAGRELTVAILDEEPLPVIELKYGARIFGYKEKYTEGGAQHVVNPPVRSAVKEQVQQVALAAYKALGCRAMGRVDVLLDGRGNPYVLEVNTIPGFTATSLMPEAAKAAGLTFPQLCEKIVLCALRTFQTAQVPQELFR